MDQSRRAFLGLAWRSSERSQAQPGREPDDAIVAVSVPIIDAARCNGCDACMSVCPRDAITLDRSEGAVSYLSRPGRCNDCDACVTLCDRGAIRIEPTSSEAPIRLNLIETTCPQCHARSHRPQLMAGRGDRCRICTMRKPRSDRIRR